jgi:catechol 2,3-dioxygenase-like lactoylglutathione lyase family enzyme
MLANRRLYPTIPAADIERAQRWYDEKLGLKPRASEAMGLIFDAGGGTGFLLYPSQQAGQAPNTLMTFSSTDVRADVTALRRKGVKFEEYDFPGLKTEDGVALLGSRHAAWFKDSEGNILAIGNEG